MANNDFSAGSGQACGAGFNNCRTGLCLQGRCAAACCTDGDCPAACVWIPTAGGEVRAICDLPNVLGGPGGSGCYGDLDCENRVCIFNPNAPQGAPPGLCAGWCCRNADCGPGLGCGQVEGPGQVITACVPRVAGAATDGESDRNGPGACEEFLPENHAAFPRPPRPGPCPGQSHLS